MISVFFNCSSPYVGFTIRQADYENHEMHLCSLKKPIMPAECYELFNNGGSTLLLGKFSNHRYFQATQTATENYDEQGRRIYASVAFVSSEAADAPVINRIAAYVFFNEKSFYDEIAKLIVLLKDGFTVDFDGLAAFVKRFEQEPLFISTSEEAKQVYTSIISASGKYDMDCVVLEATWEYLLNQIGRRYTKNSSCCFEEDKARAVAGKGRVEFKRIPGKPAEEKPVIEKPVTEKPVIEKSAAEKTVAEKPAAVVEEKPAAEMQRQTSREQIAKLQAENHEQKSRLAVMEEKAAGLAAEVLRLKEKLKQYFLVGLAIGIIGTVLAVLMINMLKQNANKTDPVSTEQIVAAAEDSDACGSYEIYALEGVL